MLIEMCKRGLRLGHDVNQNNLLVSYHSMNLPPVSAFPLLAALTSLSIFPVRAADNLPDLGEVSQASFSPQLERKVGEAIMRDIRVDRDFLNDAEVSDYINRIGYRLAAASPNNRQDFEFFVVRDDTLNSFDMPCV